MYFIFIILIVVGGIIGALAQCSYDPKKSTNIDDLIFRPDIHYKRCTEGNAEYLRKICPKDSAAAKDRLQILLDLECWDGKYFLLRDDNEKIYLRKYSICSFTVDGITRYVLEDVRNGMIRDFETTGYFLDRLCKENLGCGVQELYINYKDRFESDILINTYKTWYCLLETCRLEAALRMEREGEKRSADFDSEPDNFDPELDDFDPDTFDPYFDEIPEGYFINEFGELELGDDPDQNPNKWGSDAWWEEQERFINDSLYVNHDWEIFRREEANCKNENCHDPWHHHEK